jgi:ribosome-binding ATPase YchF (GTP1/OBG family)
VRSVHCSANWPKQADGGRGRNRRPAERGQDDALQRAHASRRWRVRQGARGHGADRGRPPAPAGRGREGEEGDVGRDPRGRRPRNLRQVDALLAVLDDWSGTRDPADDLETLKLELLVADRDHVERRLDRVQKQAKSGDASLRAEVGELERVLAHLEAGRSLSEYEGELPPELEPLTTKPLVEIWNGASGVDVKLEAELAELPVEEAAEFRDGPSALEDVALRVFEAAGLLTFFTAGETETRAWTLQRGRSALDAAASIHSDIAQGFIRAEVIRWNDLVEAGSHAEAAKRGLQRLEGKTYVVEDGDVVNVRFNV